MSCAAVLLGGCSGFFDKTSDDDTGGDTGTGTGNYLYVANAGSNTVSGYQISTTGTLTAITGTPVTVTDGTNKYAPTALTVTRNNRYLYVGTSQGIVGFKIGTAGVLSKVADGQLLGGAVASVTSLDTSPDGKWLIALYTDIAGTTLTVTAYTIASDGTIAPNVSGTPYGSTGVIVPHEVHITPNASYIYATAGLEGTLIYKFSTSSGIVTFQDRLKPVDGSTGDISLAISSDSSRLYLARTGTTEGLTQYAIGSSGSLNRVGDRYTTGNQPYSVLIDNSGKYVYVANRSDNTISGYVISSGGALTVAASSPYSAGDEVTALGAESKGNWLIAVANSGTPDVTLYGFDSATDEAGRIYTVGSANAGTTPMALALTH